MFTEVHSMSRFLPGIGLVLCAAVAAGGEPAAAPAPRVIPIAELVKQLGHADFEKREVATKRLSAMALDPPPEVLAAARSDDPEVQRRAAQVVEAMRQNVVTSRLRRGERFAEQGRIDLFVAATAVWDLKADDDRLWVPAQDLGRRLLAKNDRLINNNNRSTAAVARMIMNCPAAYPDLANYRKGHSPRFTRIDEPYLCPDPQQDTPPVLIRSEAVHATGVTSPTGICDGVIVSRGSVATQTAIQHSVLFVNGDVTAVTGLYNVVIVCDGDVNLTDDRISKAVIIARGNITSKLGATQADLIAGGKITLGKKYRESRTQFNVTFNTLKENEPNPLGFITFFELHRVGLKVKAADGAITVDAVTGGSASEKAGLKAGDAILEAAGKKPADAESLRRLLRDSLAIGDATVKLKRGNEILSVKLSLPD
jgi:hypothetical protein